MVREAWASVNTSQQQGRYAKLYAYEYHAKQNCTKHEVATDILPADAIYARAKLTDRARSWMYVYRPCGEILRALSPCCRMAGVTHDGRSDLKRDRLADAASGCRLSFETAASWYK